MKYVLPIRYLTGVQPPRVETSQPGHKSDRTPGFVAVPLLGTGAMKKVGEPPAVNHLRSTTGARAVSGRRKPARCWPVRVLAGQSGADSDEVGWRTPGDDPAAVVTGAETDVDDLVSVRHDALAVLDYDGRPTRGDRPVEQAE